MNPADTSLLLGCLLLSPNCTTAPTDSDPSAEPITAPRLDTDAGSAAHEASAVNASATVVSASQRTLQDTQVIDLFDGQSTAGWTWEPYAQGSNARPPFRVEAGLLISEGLPLGLLRHPGTFQDFVLELEYLTPKTTKNPATGGVMVRASHKDSRAARALVWPRGLEINLENGKAGDLVAHQRFPVLYERFRTKGVVTERIDRGRELRRNEWNRLEVRVQGDAITVKLNGFVVNTATGLDRAAGSIGIQAGGAEFRFRRMRVTPL